MLRLCSAASLIRKTDLDSTCFQVALSFVLKITSFTKKAKNRPSPAQTKAENKPHAKVALAIFVAKASPYSAAKPAVPTGFRVDDETGGQWSSKESSGTRAAPAPCGERRSGSTVSCASRPTANSPASQDTAERGRREI